jgi:hypothetical protein
MLTRIFVTLMTISIVAGCATTKKESEPQKESEPREYVSVKSTREALAASSSQCDQCVQVGSWIITKVGCGASELALDGACTLAEIAFPEFDVVIIPLCTALEVGLPIVCEEMGSNWVKQYPDQAAKKICETCQLCP